MHTVHTAHTVHNVQTDTLCTLCALYVLHELHTLCTPCTVRTAHTVHTVRTVHITHCTHHTQCTHCTRACCDDASQEIASLAEQVHVSKKMRACMRVYGVFRTGRTLRGDSGAASECQEPKQLALHGPPRPENTIDTHASAHPSMSQARKLLPCLDKCTFQKKRALACVPMVFSGRGGPCRASCFCCFCLVVLPGESNCSLYAQLEESTQL